MKAKKIISLILTGALLVSAAFSLTACSDKSPAGTASSTAGKDKYTIGIVQLVEHDALDAATKGFQDALKELLGDKVTFDYKNAQNDSPTCATIVNNFVSNKVDLIMANATAALQAAQAGTNEIPVLGTSITDYATALGMTNWNGKTGTNISGTSDLAPLDKQADMLHELFPNVKKVGLMYCSAEANSLYQIDTIQPKLEALGYTCTRYSFSDSNDIATVAQNACKEEVIYIPTDNTAANNTQLVNNVFQPANIPVVTGEQGICKGCGIATLSIDYYDIGYQTGKMAYEILVDGKKPGDMEIRTSTTTKKMYNANLCSALKIKVPSDYEAIPAE